VFVLTNLMDIKMKKREIPDELKERA
jgi:hypothetical protein